MVIAALVSVTLSIVVASVLDSYLHSLLKYNLSNLGTIVAFLVFYLSNIVLSTAVSYYLSTDEVALIWFVVQVFITASLFCLYDLAFLIYRKQCDNYGALRAILFCMSIGLGMLLGFNLY